MRTIIHVNQHKLRSNTKNGTSDPVLTVKTYKDNRYMSDAVIRDDEGNEVARVVYRPHNPLSCGARCWIETKLEVTDSQGKDMPRVGSKKFSYSKSGRAAAKRYAKKTGKKSTSKRKKK